MEIYSIPWRAVLGLATIGGFAWAGFVLVFNFEGVCEFGFVNFLTVVGSLILIYSMALGIFLFYIQQWLERRKER